MYHTRKATERRGKVYALLGMSSDDPRSAGLFPDYTITWNVLFQRLAKYILSDRIFIETWANREIADSAVAVSARVEIQYNE